MALWIRPPSLEQINRSHDNTAVAQLGIEFTEVGEDHLVATMPVDARTRQPAGLLHGGATLLLAETLASCAAWQTIDRATTDAVGLEINANHLRAVREGRVTGRVTPVHTGRSTQIWQVEVRDAQDRLVCVSRATISLIRREPAPR
ncbi:MAG: hotdog fold thioesterase [Burkholderiales bacterium]|nr:hotdog fold thioesterase [Burkholderiales bacterium]